MERRTFEKIFSEFNDINVLIIGDIMMDAYIWGSAERISPEAPVPVVKVSKKDYRLGGAANVALNVLALGAKPILCGVIGDDDNGKRLVERMAERGISEEGVVQCQGRPTTVKTRILSGHQHVVRIDEESNKLVSSDIEQELKGKLGHLLPKSDVVVFEDYDKGVISQAIIDLVVKKAAELEIPVVADPKKRNFLFYKNVTLFKPNLKELRDGLKIDIEQGNKIEVRNAIQQVIEKLQCKGALVTLSEMGICINYNDESHMIPAHVRDISDVSGAGDTVISVAALCIALKLSPFLIAALSNLGGGLVCEHLGVVPINKREMLAEAKRTNWL